MERFKRIVKRLFIGVIATLGIAALAIFILLRYYEDDVVGYAIKQINSRLTTEASVASVDLTYWETFPNASLKFQEVYIEETFSKKDTLLYAKDIFLEFSLMDLFRKNYNIKAISANEGKIFLRINKKGENNWSIFKPAESSEEGLALKLEQVEASNIHAIYEDVKTQFFMDYVLGDGDFQGDFEAGDFDLTMDFTGRMQTLISGYDELVSDRALAVKGALGIESTKASYTLKDLQLKVDGIPFLVSGNYTAGAIDAIDLNIAGDNLTMQSILNILPSGYKENITRYDASGVVSFAGRVHGKVGGKNRPNVTARFEVEDGSIEHESTGTRFERIRLKGDYVLGAKEDQLRFEAFSGALQAGTISGEGVIYNLRSPRADLRMRADVLLNDLKAFLNWDTLAVCEGRIVAEMQYKGAIDASAKTDFNAIQASGRAELSGARLQLQGSARLFEQLGAKVDFDNRNAYVKQMSGVVNGSDFNINGALNNLLPFLLSPSEKLQVEASLKSQVIDFGQLIESTSSKNEEYVFSLPERMT